MYTVVYMCTVRGVARIFTRGGNGSAERAREVHGCLGAEPLVGAGLGDKSVCTVVTSL